MTRFYTDFSSSARATVKLQCVLTGHAYSRAASALQLCISAVDLGPSEECWLAVYVYVTTWSIVNHTSVTSIMHCKPCCNKLISWPSQTLSVTANRIGVGHRLRRACLEWVYRRIREDAINMTVQTAASVLGILAATAVRRTFVKHVWK